MRFTGRASSDAQISGLRSVAKAKRTTTKLCARPTETLPVFQDNMAVISETGVANHEVAGVAFSGGLCSERNVGAGEDKAGGYTAVETTAHELLHLLGAQHDGQTGLTSVPNTPGGTACPAHDGYLMNPVLNGSNRYHLSSCTIKQVRAFLRTVPMSCLEETASKDYTSKHKMLPGQEINHDQFCAAVMKDKGSGELTVERHPTNPCLIMCCLTTLFGTLTCQQVDAPEGMACGPEMICLNGICGQ